MSGRGTVLGGRYTLTARIGGGGMGSVWQADDAVLGRQVAVKILHAALLEDGTFARRFRREAQLLAALSHPGVVDVHDYGEEGPDEDGERAAYIVMELIDGRPLDKVLAEDGVLPPDRALGLLAAALDALHAAHRRDIVHRDVKPSNLMVRDDDRVTVTDFGIARATAGTRLTASHAVIGTALYMAPEQAEGKEITPAADLYAVGVVCFELLTGRPPFTGESVLEVALKHLREPVPALPESIPAAVRAIVTTALAKQPGDRFADAAAMAEAARAAVAPGAVASPVTPPAVPAAPPAAAPAVPPAVVDEVVSRAATEPVPRSRRRGFLVPIVLPLVISVGTATVLLIDKAPFTSEAQTPGSAPPVAVTVTATVPAAPLPATVQPTAAPSGTPSGTETALPPATGPSKSATGPARTTAPQQPPAATAPGGTGPAAPPLPSAVTAPPVPSGATAAPPALPRPSAPAASPSAQPPAAVPAGCGGTNWGYLTNVGDGLRVGLSQDSLAGGQAVVMGGASAYGWVHTVPSSWHQFNPCKLSAPPLVQDMDGKVVLSNGFSFMTNWTVTPATTSGAFYLKDYMGQNCLTDNGAGAQLTMTVCTPGNKSQEFRVP
ncbi:protein kinase [Kitasatospora sp. NPDC058201]|uniref:serine/threonine-protein kinase n=1 Tax=unclassified Kitasatospora TaxID=2633591 RepID=UPI0036633318